MTEELLVEILKEKEAFIEELKKLPKMQHIDTNKLYHSCILILGSLWNENKDYFLNAECAKNAGRNKKINQKV